MIYGSHSNFYFYKGKTYMKIPTVLSCWKKYERMFSFWNYDVVRVFYKINCFISVSMIIKKKKKSFGAKIIPEKVLTNSL